MVRVGALSVACLLALTLAGCEAPQPADEPVETSAVAAECPRFAATSREVAFGVNGARNLVGLEVGNGTVGVILAHQLDYDLCNWMGMANRLADQGYRALAFDFNDFGASAASGEYLDKDVAAAVAFLRGEGVTSIVLIGASMGGTAVIAAAADIAPPVTAVVSISGPVGFGLVSVNGADAAARLTMPTLYQASTGDRQAAASAQAMYDNTPERYRELQFYAGADHGTSLVNAGGSLVGLPALDAFLATHAPVAS